MRRRALPEFEPVADPRSRYDDPMQNDRVVIVGAGPVGLTAALALGRRGIPTVLLAAESELVMELRVRRSTRRRSICWTSSESCRA